MLKGFFNESMLHRAQTKGLVEIVLWDIRKYTTDKHKTVDDYAYGGGPGMIMKPEPIFRCMDDLIEKTSDSARRVIFMTPQGERFSQTKAESLAKESHLIFLCGHYRGVDERVIEDLVDEEISIGDYILTGGEIPAAVVVDSIVRLIPGVLSDSESAEADSFACGQLDHPHYTRPAEYRGKRVPDVLLSGHHADIEAWRKEKSKEKTEQKRPDLLNK